MSNKNKKWDRPPAPATMFFNKKEKDFSKQISDQLTESVISQEIVYFPISTSTSYHPLYGEAIEKLFDHPIHIYALVEWVGQATETTNYGLDRRASPLKIHFNSRRLSEDANLYVREGDFIQWDSEFFEIVDLAEPSLMFGQTNRVEITATCIRARDGMFNGWE